MSAVFVAHSESLHRYTHLAKAQYSTTTQDRQTPLGLAESTGEGYIMYRITHQEKLSDVVFQWDVHAPDVANAAQPGQFVMLRLHEGSERIPLTVADYDREAGTITMVIQALGKTTKEMMTHYSTGDTFKDFVGPVGRPQHISNLGHVVLVGGGLGIAPIYPQLRAFKEAGNRVTAIVGFRNRDLMFWLERFERYADDLIVCTDDGSYGRPGFVTEALQELLENDKPDLVVAIGPLPMMHACTNTTRPFKVKTMVSLNAIMVDGTGMCGSCRVTVDGKVRFACVEGPDFDGHLVDFPELIARQRRFKAQEAKANEDYSHVCDIERILFEEEKRSYKKLKTLLPEQVPMPERSAKSRMTNFKEVNLGYSIEDAIEEAERCIQCKNPTCIAGCPVQIDIPRFIRYLLVRDINGARDVINENNLFPSICGRVCPQESQCESQCVLIKKMEPVAIGRLERFVGDNAKPKVLQRPRFELSLGRVAIVGSGPAGLAAAADLVRCGAEVTVFEALHVIGGVLQYGIPSFRLPREIISREVKTLRDMGVRFETNKVVGKTFTVDQLLAERGFDAVFLGVGAGAPSFLGIPGESAGQVYSANEFLTRVNLMGGNQFPYRDTPVALGDSVVVIGAGNTAMDCLRVAKRLGVPRVRCVYRRTEAEATARDEELRHAKEEGIEFFFLHSPVAVLTDEPGDVTGLKVERMELGEPDERGRRRPVGTGEISEIDCNTVIIALGTQANPIIPETTPDLGCNKWGYVVADDKLQTTTKRAVFAGGDIVTGGATVILAMGAGRRAARSIACWLSGNCAAWPPTREEVDAYVPPHPLPNLPEPPEEAVARVLEAEHRFGETQSPVHLGDQTVHWECNDCGKVSEGIAMPYGRCALCGGKLSMVEPETLENAAAIATVRAAFEIQLGAHAFYSRAASKAEDPILRAMFTHFAELEHAQMTTLAKRFHTTPPDDSAEIKLTRAAQFAHFEQHPEDPLNLLRLAIAFEQRALEKVDERLATTEHGSEERKVLKMLRAEEHAHIGMLMTELERWNMGKPGMTFGVAAGQ
jgi:glutamate synthase (NADPH/NADH) small chain